MKTIPRNFVETGRIMGIRIRNLFETAIADGLVILFIRSLDFSTKYKIYCGSALIPITVMLIIGIDGQSVTTYIIDYFKFLSNRRMLGKPDAEYMKQKDKAILKQQKKRRKEEKVAIKGKR